MPWRARLQLYVLSVMEGRTTDQLLRLLLACGVPLYWLGLRCSRALTRPQRLPRPVISIGNLTVGGTGKTPVVAWLVARLQRQGRRVAILSRGYGRAVGATGLVDLDGVESPAACYGDEPVLLARRLGVPVLIGSDRVANGRDALRHGDVGCFILDDGFQHWALARDLEIVLLDGERPFGSGHLLPWGTLREPVAALRRAHVILVRQTAEAPPLDGLREALRRHAVTAPVVPIRYRVTAVEEPLTGQSREMSSLAGLRVRLLSSVAQPASFESLVRSMGIDVAAHARYPDHYAYTAADLRRRDGGGTEPLLTTEKDWMRLEPLARATPPAAPLLVLRIDVELVNPNDDTLIDDRLARLFSR